MPFLYHSYDYVSISYIRPYHCTAWSNSVKYRDTLSNQPPLIYSQPYYTNTPFLIRRNMTNEMSSFALKPNPIRFHLHLVLFIACHIHNLITLWLRTALNLGERCFYNQSCMYFDKNTLCVNLDDYTAKCQCRTGFYPSVTLESISRTSICIPGNTYKCSVVSHQHYLLSNSYVIPSIIHIYTRI